MLIAEHSGNSDESHGLTNDNHRRISGITFLRFLHTRKYLLKRIVEFGLGILTCNRTLVYLPSGYQKLSSSKSYVTRTRTSQKKELTEANEVRIRIRAQASISGVRQKLAVFPRHLFRSGFLSKVSMQNRGGTTSSEGSPKILRTRYGSFESTAFVR